jgi:hypothetical protein
MIVDDGDDLPADEKMDIGFHRMRPLIPEKMLRDWIQENVNLSLKSVPWDLADDKLVPEAGACGSCLKRSVSNPSLFLGLTRANDHDNCFDPACFQSKQKAFVKLQLKTAKTAEKPLVQISEQTAYTKPKEGEKILKKGQWLPAKKGECEGVTKALIVRGENAGEQQLVCADLNCKVHKRHLSAGGTSFDSGRSAEDVTAQREDERINGLVVERILVRRCQDQKAGYQSSAHPVRSADRKLVWRLRDDRARLRAEVQRRSGRRKGGASLSEKGESRGNDAAGVPGFSLGRDADLDA